MLFVLLALTGCNSGENTNSESGSAGSENTAESVATDLPSMPVTMTDRMMYNMDELKGKTILVLFQPDCDHCQREAASIQENLDSFSEYQVYFISSASLPELLQFAETYKLDNASNFHFGSATVDNIVGNFGSIPTPSMYIYSDTGNLVKEFEGETPIEEILEVI